MIYTLLTCVPPHIVCHCFYAPNFKEVDGAYWFQVVCASVCPSVRSRTVHARVLKFHIWIPDGKIFDTHFFSCPSYLPFWSYAPLNKIWMKSVACHILWTLHARVLKLHICIPHGKIADPYFFSCLCYLSFWSYASLKKSEWNVVSKISRKVFELGSWNLVSW